MKPLDRKLQRRVWARVYQGEAVALTQQQRQRVRQSLSRSRENLAFYEKMENHGIYAEAFTKLRAETAEQIKMLQQMLR